MFYSENSTNLEKKYVETSTSDLATAKTAKCLKILFIDSK